jgi:hypothetical protein
MSLVRWIGWDAVAYDDQARLSLEQTMLEIKFNFSIYLISYSMKNSGRQVFDA